MTEIRKANGHRLETVGVPFEPEIEPQRRPQQSELDFDLAATLSAVFAIETRVPQDAFTAGGLGTERFGNAVLISGEGLFLTIGYLVTEADQVTLTATDGTAVAGHVVGFDHETGFGLVQAHGHVDAVPIRRGSSDGLSESDTVVIAAHGGPASAQLAKVVSKRTFAGYWEYLLEEAIFTSPPHPSWSGAALLDKGGTMRGLGSLYVQDAEPGDRPVPGNMFVPLDILDPILADLATTGRSRRPPKPWLGMYTSAVEDTLVVAGLAASGPASLAGVEVGDVIVGVARQPISDHIELLRRIRASGDAGAIVNLQIYRDGSVMDVNVRSGNRYDYLKLPKSH